MPLLIADRWLRSLLDVKVKRPEACDTEYEAVNRLFRCPNILEVQTALGYLTEGRFGQGLTACERLLKRKPWFLPLYTWGAISAVELDLPYRAWQFVDEGLEQLSQQQTEFMENTLSWPETVQRKFGRERARLIKVLAFAFGRARNYSEALSLLEDGQALDSEWWAWWMARGRVAWLNGSVGVARTYFSMGLEDSQESSQRAAYHVELGRLREAEGHFGDGFGHFVEARNLALNDGVTSEVFLRALLDRGRFDEAAVEAQRIKTIVLEGECVRGPLEALLASVEKNMARAIGLKDRVSLLESQSLASPDPRPYFRLGRMLMRSGQAVNAVEVWVDGLRDAPWDVDCAVSAARVFVEMGGWGKALEIVECAISDNERCEREKDVRLEALRCYVLAQSSRRRPLVAISLSRCLKLMSKRPRTKKKHRSELMEAISDVVRTVCVLQSWRYLVPALELLDLLERSTAADSPGIEEDAVDSKLRDDAVVSARNLKHEQFIEVPVFDRMAPLVRYLAGLYHRYQERRAVLPLRIVDVAITTLVESYSEHEGQIVREYQRICKKEAPKGRPAKRLSAVRIEKLLSEGLSLEKIGERLRVHRNTIYRQAETSPVLRSALDRGRIKYRRSPLAVEPSGYQN